MTFGLLVTRWKRRAFRAWWLAEAARMCCAQGYHGRVNGGTSARYDVCAVCGARFAPLKGRA